jgi:hypothetical protein
MDRQFSWGPKKPSYAFLVWGCVIAVAGTYYSSKCHAQAAAGETAAAESESEASEKVLRHAVFFKFKPTAAKADVERLVKAFSALPSKIHEISEFQSGENISRFEGDERFTHCFLLTFKDEAGRAAYLPHPDHKAFGSALGPHLAGVFVIDYWGRPPAARLEKELKHAVFVKFKENTTPDEVRAVGAGLAALPAKIDAIKAFEWGTNNSPETHDQGFTHCFMFTFDSEEGLKEYADHPAHREAGSQLLSQMDKIRVIDFWAENAPAGDAR